MKSNLIERAGELGVGDRVTFLGGIAYDQLPDLLASADIFVMPSRKDTHPLTVIEAMASELAVIVVNSPAYEGMIMNGVNGICCQPGWQDFARGMEAMVADPILRGMVAAEGKKTSQGYSIEATTRIIIEVYERAMEDWKRRAAR
jgi:D-inositol-3-phosphate glycosyltransferase